MLPRLILLNLIASLTIMVSAVVSATPLFSPTSDQRCLQLFAPVQRLGTSEPRDRIHPTVRAWLELKAGRSTPPPTLRSGDSLYINGKRTRIVEFLGKGGQGTIYLVETLSGLAVAKIFLNQLYFVDSQRTIRKSASLLPRIIDRDVQAGILLMEYREGISIYEIRRNNRQLGISDADFNRIISNWNRWNPQPGWFETSPVRDENNVIYSFTEDTYYFIDPI